MAIVYSSVESMIFNIGICVTCLQCWIPVSFLDGQPTQLMGLAVYNGIILDLNFPPCCFKKLLVPPLLTGNSELSRNGMDEQSSISLSKLMAEAPKFSLDDLATVMPVCTVNV